MDTTTYFYGYSDPEPVDAWVDGAPATCQVRHGVPIYHDRPPVLRVTLPCGRWVEIEGPTLDDHVTALWRRTYGRPTVGDLVVAVGRHLRALVRRGRAEGGGT